MNYRSIVNDILGPIMAGPSSSHSAGCARIGRLARCLWGRDIKRAVVVYDSHGSYPGTCEGQGSNFGFTGGLIGMKNDDPRIKDSRKIAAEQGIDISFSVETLSGSHPNEARIDVYDGENVRMSLLTFSTGGGMFRIAEMDGFPVEMDGSKKQIFALLSEENAEHAKKMAAEYGSSELIRGRLLCITGIKNEEALLRELRSFCPEYIRYADVILPLPVKNGVPPFTTVPEALAYAEKTGADLPGLGLEYELSVADADEREIMKEMHRLLDAMRGASQAPDPRKTEKFGFLPYRCRDMMARSASVKTVDTGWLNKAMFYAVAVMENSCAHNIVTASPTAGSSGVIPAAVVAVGEEMGLSDEEIIRGLLAAGLAGSFIGNHATFGAEVAGCQAENGSASAMAACGVVQLLGGTAEQGFMAASLALQNTLGLVCDPVGGLTEIPCISRNVMAMSNAVMAANMVMLGFDPVIPFDEVIGVMMDIGRKMPEELRCTCRGGLCVTETACKKVREIKK